MKRVLVSMFALALIGAPVAHAQVVVAPPPVPDYYDSYYDGFYGPFVDGYWGDDGGFWYEDGGHAWRRDGGGHFRRDARQGFNHVHGSGGHRDH